MRWEFRIKIPNEVSHFIKLTTKTWKTRNYLNFLNYWTLNLRTANLSSRKGKLMQVLLRNQFVELTNNWAIKKKFRKNRKLTCLIKAISFKILKRI